MEEDDSSLQPSAGVFDWDGDAEERFAMEKVHGVNDFDKDDQSRFSTMDEVSPFGGDDDWRALASEAQVEVEHKAEVDGDVAPSTSIQTSDAEAGEEFERLGGDGDLQIMRFSRKKTAANVRVRRKSEEEQEQPKLKVTVKTESELPPVQAARKVDEMKHVLVGLPARPRPVLQVKPEGKPGIRVEQTRVQNRFELQKKVRPKQPLKSPGEQQLQNKKPKALAFQKSRNIINKRINADTVKPEPTLEFGCGQVRAILGKHKAVTTEVKALNEEIRPLISADDDSGFKDLSSSLHAKWLGMHCKQLRSRFDVHFTVAEHFLCHSPDHCSSS